MDVLQTYRMTVHWSEEDQEYVALCPAFGPGVSALAPTPDGALAELQTVLELVLETYQEHGWVLPQSDLPPTDYSGKFLVRLPKSLHARLAHQAEAEGVSLNALVTTILAEAIGLQTAQQTPPLPMWSLD